MTTNSSINPVFVIPAQGPDELEAHKLRNVDNDWLQFNDGPHCWALQTFLLLTQAGIKATLANNIVPGRINLVHSSLLAGLATEPKAFVVSLQADYPRVPWADFHVVQNQHQASAPTSAWVPLWPQPGLISRCSKRSGVTNIAFAGRPVWLASTRELWSVELNKLGLSFDVLGPKNWNDYSQADVLIGIRSFDGSPYYERPPSKLVNAWHARVPLIGGTDSAFEQIGTPGVDYLRATSFADVLGYLARLKNNSTFYEKLVLAGTARSGDFSRASICDRWEQLLTAEIIPAFDSWNDTGCRRSAKWYAQVTRWHAYFWLRSSFSIAKKLAYRVHAKRRRQRQMKGI